MDLLHIFSSINNTFFSVLVIIFSNVSYFCFNYTNTLFIHAMNYFSVVPWIIFLMCIKNYFFNCRAENYFWQYREYIFWSSVHCGPCIWSGLVRVFDLLWSFWKLCKWRSTFKENAKAKHCQRKKQKRFSSLLQNLLGASSLSLVMRFSGPKI